MKERPILFNTEMVKAILEGRKTQSRRPIKPDIVNCFDLERDGSLQITTIEDQYGDLIPIVDFCPFGQIGDHLYVRETWKFIGTNMNRLGRTHSQQDGIFRYKADNEQKQITRHWEDIEKYMTKGTSWKPSIHMPKWVSRIWLEITDLRVERVQSITEEGAQKEGFIYEGWVPSYNDPDSGGDGNPIYPTDNFFETWSKIYGIENMWVWVIEFKRIEKC